MQTEHKNGGNMINVTEITTSLRLSLQMEHNNGGNTANVIEITTSLRLSIQTDYKNGTNMVFSFAISNALSYFFVKLKSTSRIHFLHTLPMADPPALVTAHLLSLPAEIRLKIILTAATHSSVDTQTLRSFLLLCRDFYTLLIANFSIIVVHYTVKAELPN